MTIARNPHLSHAMHVAGGAVVGVAIFLGIKHSMSNAVQGHPPISDLTEADFEPPLPPQADISQGAGAEEGSTEYIEGRRYA